MARKLEAALPVLPTAKPPLPPGHPQCAASDTCRKPGLVSPQLEGLLGFDPKDRLCVDHYVIALERNRRAINT